MVPNPRLFGADTGGPIILRPAHYEGLSLGLPADIQTTRILRERPVFSGIGGKFVKREPDCLRRGCIQTQLRAAHRDTRANVIGEGGRAGREPGARPRPHAIRFRMSGSAFNESWEWRRDLNPQPPARMFQWSPAK